VERDLRARWQIEVCSFGAFPDIAFGQNKTSAQSRCQVRWPQNIPNLALHFALCRFTNSELMKPIWLGPWLF
jgi:hypothetical protein